MDTIGKCTTEAFAVEDEYGDEYGDEILYAGWNPQLDLAGASLEVQDDWHIMPADLVDADTETFLRKMYEYQC